MVESFENYPISIAETKALKSRNGADWTPRDALIACLREIDQGHEVPIDVIICMAVEDPDGKVQACTRYWLAGPGGIFPKLGLLERVKSLLNKD